MRFPYKITLLLQLQGVSGNYTSAGQDKRRGEGEGMWERHGAGRQEGDHRGSL